MTKPTDDVSWSTDPTFTSGPETGTATKVNPTDAQKQGFVPGGRFLSQHVNWALNLVHQWLLYLKNLHTEVEFLNKAYAWIGQHTFAPTAPNTAGVAATSTGTAPGGLFTAGGTGAGLSATGAATAPGAELTGGSGGGDGAVGNGVGAGRGGVFTGGTSGAGVRGIGQGGHPGAHFTAASGAALTATGAVGHQACTFASGTGADGIQCTGDSTNFAAVRGTGANGATGVLGIASGNGVGVWGQGVAGAGVVGESSGGNSGGQFSITGGTAGVTDALTATVFGAGRAGVFAQGPIGVIGSGQTYGVQALGSALSNGTGLRAVAAGTGKGAEIEATTGTGVAVVTGAGTGIAVDSTGIGLDVDSTGGSTPAVLVNPGGGGGVRIMSADGDEGQIVLESTVPDPPGVAGSGRMIIWFDGGALKGRIGASGVFTIWP